GPTITVTQATGGTISPGTASYTNGDDQDFTATPTICYTFTNWVVDGVNVGNANPYSFTNITGDHTITANYTENPINFANIQWPTTTQTITQGATTNVVYAQVYEPGITDTPNAQGSGILAWIGYSSSNT